MSKREGPPLVGSDVASPARPHTLIVRRGGYYPDLTHAPGAAGVGGTCQPKSRRYTRTRTVPGGGYAPAAYKHRIEASWLFTLRLRRRCVSSRVPRASAFGTAMTQLLPHLLELLALLAG